MIWGVGTGRCGTKSLSERLGGVHEPKPWMLEHPAYYRRGLIGPDECIKTILGRMELGASSCVDFKQSFVMDLIVKQDKDWRFVWIIRNPMECVSSFLSGGGFTKQDLFGERYIQPAAGWGDEKSQLKRIAYHWLQTNRMVHGYLQTLSPARFCALFTDDLGDSHWTNRYPEDRRTDYTKQEAAWLFDYCAEDWAMFTDFIEAHHADACDWFPKEGA